MPREPKDQKVSRIVRQVSKEEGGLNSTARRKLRESLGKAVKNDPPASRKVKGIKTNLGGGNKKNRRSYRDPTGFGDDPFGDLYLHLKYERF